MQQQAAAAFDPGHHAGDFAQVQAEDAVPEPVRVGGEVQVFADEVVEAVDCQGELGGAS
jgi:hypothetical protein